MRLLAFACTVALASTPGASHAAEGAGFDDEIVVVGAAPGSGIELATQRLPFSVQSADADAFARAQSNDLTDFLAHQLGSVNVNSAQGNPLQPDVQFRGYSVSPLLGLAQGVAVYQNGVRINEPLGDAVNWDLLPESAVNSISLVGGSNPLYGLNALGGALAVEMKNGFNFSGHMLEVAGGSWERVTTTAESGANSGVLGYYINVSYFDEDGWRDLSASDAMNVYADASFRANGTSLDLALQYGSSDLTGNGALPIGMLALDRDSVFTAPDITENELVAFTFNGKQALAEALELGVTAFHRDNSTDSFNGDGADLLVCELGAGTFLLEDLEGDELEELGLDEEEVCADNVLGVATPDDLATALNALAAPGDDEFDLDDLTSDLSGSGVLADAAINNISRREQRSYGADVQFGSTRDWFGRANALVVGASVFEGVAEFASVIELANLDPVTRSTQGLGVGTFIDEQATNVTTSTTTWSVFFMNALDLTPAFTLTIGGRYNDTQVEIDDRSGVRPELEGEHGFARFNPTIGATYAIAAGINAYASYSESSRAPTPIELSCNEGVFEVARAAAIARGDDPDDVDFECRLPNAFLADPPLDDVVAKGVEVGVRGRLGVVQHRLGYFRTVNHDDIIFQTTGRGTGLFGNVDKTRREGFESAFAISFGKLDYSIAYSYVHATFEDEFSVASPNHPLATESGDLAVERGDHLPGVPDHQFKFNADYALPWALRAGVEVLYNSGQYLRGDEANGLDQLDGYAVVNLRANYSVARRVELFARLTNVFDVDYQNFGLLGEDPAEILPDLADQRPIFVGVGAPRGAWVGVRLTL
jgi:outer membrane receptor protein involved in Fe transport